MDNILTNTETLPDHLVWSNTVSYLLEKEDELLASLSKGDTPVAKAALNDILGHILYYSGGDIEVLRLHVLELTVLLSRAALKGGANNEAIFGLKQGFLREINALSSQDDIIIWLHGVMQRFEQHVFIAASNKHPNVIRRAIAFIKHNFAKKMTLQDIADHVYMSPSYFSKVFKDETGQSPISFLTAYRIEESKRLLMDLSVNIIDIPEKVGFEGQSYYTRVFKRAEGMTPGQYRRSGRHV